MRVIAGEAKGRELVPPKGGATRPATDRIRETLFAILEPDLPDTRVLDLFAGSGALGIEALSRGALHATFVERSKDALTALQTNIRACGFEGRADVVPTNVLAFVDAPIVVPYEIAFVDPPFADVAVLEAVLARLPLVSALSSRRAIVVARALKKHRPAIPEAATAYRTKELGEEVLLFLRYSGAGGGG